MAIAIDSVNVGNLTGTNLGSSFSYNHTCTGSNLVLVVILEIDNAGTTATVKYNGVSMTQAASNVTGHGLRTFYLSNPSTGTNVVQVTLSNDTYCLIQSVSFTGANTSNPIDVTGVSNYTTTPSVTLTTNYNNTYLIQSYISSGNATNTPISGQTVISTLVVAGRRMQSSYKLITTAGSTTVAYGGVANTQTLVVGIREYVAPVGSSKFFQLF